MRVNGLVGSCLCRRVRFIYNGPLAGELGLVTVCHCEQCRKAQGYAAGVVPALWEGFRILSGADAVREYESSPGKWRAFCQVCGSPLYSRKASSPRAVRLRLGTLDAPPAELTVQARIFCGGAPAWAADTDAPSYPGEEPGRPV